MRARGFAVFEAGLGRVNWLGVVQDDRIEKLVVLPPHLTAAGPVIDTAWDIRQHSG
jgi:hypothetical protein